MTVIRFRQILKSQFVNIRFYSLYWWEDYLPTFFQLVQKYEKLKENKIRNKIENILKDKTLTKEQKVKIINDYFDAYRKQTDSELNKYITRQNIGAALEIGSAALPVGGVGKIGGTIGKELLKKQLGRKISENIGTGMLSGAASGGLFGLGESLIKETNPILSTLQGA